MGNLQRRISLVVVGLIVATQAATVATVLAQAAADAEQRARAQLALGCAVVREFMRQRNDRLDTTAAVLVSDFGFRRAVATADLPTVRSALRNHAARIGAGYAVLLSPTGELLASTDESIPHSGISSKDWTDLTRSAHDSLVLSAAGGRAYQMVAAPVRAPEPVAWVAMGFAIDDQLAVEIKRIVGMEVSFSSVDETGSHTLARTIVPVDASTEQYFEVEDTLGTLGTDLRLTLSVKRAEALGAFHELTRSMVLLGLLALAAGALGAFAVARRLARPILDLARVTSAIRDGDYDVAVETGSRDEIGELARTIDSMQSEIKSREAHIRRQASHDGQTGLPSRDLAGANLARMIAAPGAGLSVMIVAFHGIQDVNSSLGLPIGEAVIRTVANRLRQLVGGEDRLARVADTRFLVLLPNQREERAEQLARTIANELSVLTVADDLDVSLTTAVGIAQHPAHGNAPDDLIRKAWVASMAAATTRDGIAIYDPTVEAKHARRLELTQLLRAARLEQQLDLHYQPKVRAPDEQAIGVEALLRWRHPGLGMIPPDEFIPLAERSGSIQRLTRWVLRTAIDALASRGTENPALTVAVNVSARDISDPNFPTLVTSLLTDHGMPPNRLELEITESALFDDLPKALTTLEQLRDVGIHVAIDDYGTGFSSLGQLKQLPVDTLKIDKSFVTNLETSTEDALIVRSTIELAHSLKLSVVAEGVETEAAARTLIGWGCDVLQGYHYARPMAATELDRWLAGLRTERAPETRLALPARG